MGNESARRPVFHLLTAGEKPSEPHPHCEETTMHVVAFNFSPRRDGNSAGQISLIGTVLEQQGIACEKIQVGGKLFTGCGACRACLRERDGHCVIRDSPINEWFQKMRAADGIVLAAPSYANDVPGEGIAFMERIINLNRSTMSPDTGEGVLARKVGVGVCSTRRTGGTIVVRYLHALFIETEMLIPGANECNGNIGRERGEFINDVAAVENTKILAANMAWLLHRLHRHSLGEKTV